MKSKVVRFYVVRLTGKEFTRIVGALYASPDRTGDCKKLADKILDKAVREYSKGKGRK